MKEDIWSGDWTVHVVFKYAEAFSQIYSPWLGDKVDSGIGLSYYPARLHRLADRYDNPMPESTISQFRDYEFGYSCRKGWGGGGAGGLSDTSPLTTIKFLSWFMDISFKDDLLGVSSMIQSDAAIRRQYFTVKIVNFPKYEPDLTAMIAQTLVPVILI
jgi:hypothetical protein